MVSVSNSCLIEALLLLSDLNHASPWAESLAKSHARDLLGSCCSSWRGWGYRVAAPHCPPLGVTCRVGCDGGGSVFEGDSIWGTAPDNTHLWGCCVGGLVSRVACYSETFSSTLWLVRIRSGVTPTKGSKDLSMTGWWGLGDDAQVAHAGRQGMLYLGTVRSPPHPWGQGPCCNLSRLVTTQCHIDDGLPGVAH